jgi:ATP-dependent helicase/nuclease subunit A
MVESADQVARARFREELDKNFSVVASAGSGKTHAITERIVSIAKSERATQWLPTLVVVTYTNRAANEMQQRARQQIIEAGLEAKVMSAFNRAFFGTIHSFCVKLVAAHGHYLGLPPQLELLEDDEELWNDFVQRQQTIGRELNEEARAVLLRHVEIRKLMELGRRGGIDPIQPNHDGACPPLDFSALLKIEPRPPSVETIDRTQERLRDWQRTFEEDAEFLPLPTSDCQAQRWIALWRETFAPFRNWLNNVMLCAAAEIERDYREFRLTRGAFTYADQVALAVELFQNAEVANRIRAKNYRVILDEAQDTGPSQFNVLLEATRPMNAGGTWPNELSDPPRSGHFCMVGDFQQSIFSQHADLQNYQCVHDALVADSAGEALKFSVTFRLDRENLKLINETFGELLSGSEGQVELVELAGRPDVLPGQVLRVDLELPEKLKPDMPERWRAASEATELARWIRRAGLKNLRAQSWSDVAILCPRKVWFPTLRDALRREKFSVQIQSETEVRGDNPAYAWLTALLTLMTQPHATYETVGVLREVFGVSDHDLAIFCDRNGERFDLRRRQNGKNIVTEKLNQLAKIREALATLPLFTAVQETIGAVQLRERLHALPEEDFENLDEELNRLLAAAAEAEVDGATLADVAKHLRSNFEANREPSAAKEDAIQLITAHKAKGSEWEAVIIPFLARQVWFSSSNFPRLVQVPDSNEPMILLDAGDITKEVKEELDRMQRQEMERLLYVALTRAKHTLVLASDADLFPARHGEVFKRSQMKWLRCETGGCNEEVFARLSADAQRCEETERLQTARFGKSQAQTTALPMMTTTSREKMEKRAQDFVRKMNPSGFEQIFQLTDEPAPGEPDSARMLAGRFDNAATRYGHWWHQFLQRLPWNEEPAWDEILEAALCDAPDRKRAEKEWKLLCAHISGTEDFRKQFTADQFTTRAEVPFLLKIKPSLALEGIIDLALIDSRVKRALIIDWKTNRIGRGEVEALRERYRPQIAAYWKAMVEITGFKIEAGLYSTATGLVSFYKSNELEREWRRLEKLPTDQMVGEVSAT